MEEPIQMPYVAYFEMVYRFEEDVYGFERFNDDMKLNRYGEILEINVFSQEVAFI